MYIICDTELGSSGTEVKFKRQMWSAKYVSTRQIKSPTQKTTAIKLQTNLNSESFVYFVDVKVSVLCEGQFRADIWKQLSRPE